MSKKLCVYTDGSCLNNGKKNSIGAIGIYFSDDDPDNLGQVIDNDGNKVTNQTMELLACLQALRLIKEKNKKEKANIIYIYTDSSYMINCMTKWYNAWEKNGWKNTKGKDVENKELIQALYNLKSEFIVIFKHIRSHQDEPTNKNSEEHLHWYGNFMADKFATDACKEFVKEKELEAKIEAELKAKADDVQTTNSDEEKELANVVQKAKTSKSKIVAKKKAKNSLNF
jgi:ribonuclease HI